MARPKLPKGRGQEVIISLRLQKELLRRLDAYAADMTKQDPGPEWSRSDAIRRVLHAALSTAPTSTEVLAAVRACRDRDSGLAEVPVVVRKLWTPGRSLEAVHAALIEADRGNELELRPESGMGRLSAVEAVLCPQGNKGAPFSWCRIRESGESASKRKAK